jgi:cysteine desulfurase / selenocysteine lyase
MFNKSNDLFPSKGKLTSLNHCGVSPLYGPSAAAAAEYFTAFSYRGSAAVDHHRGAIEEFKDAAAALIGTDAANISFIDNCALGLNLIASGLQLEHGDEIVSYRYEYPSNHYPWKLQEKRGAILKLIEGDSYKGRPLRWSLEELERTITPRTKVVALSHVQFASGFCCDLEALATLTRERGIFLVLDAAQSLGTTPVDVEKLGVDALVTSGWKWLLGPVGSGILFTSARLRENLGHVLVGPDMMTQGCDFLNHSFQPFSDGRRFEFSTVPTVVALGLARALKQIPLNYGVGTVRDEILRLQDLLRFALDRALFEPSPLEAHERAGILSFVLKPGLAETLAQKLTERGVLTSARGGYLRFAPHFYHDDLEVLRVAEVANQLAWELNS